MGGQPIPEREQLNRGGPERPNMLVALAVVDRNPVADSNGPLVDIQSSDSLKHPLHGTPPLKPVGHGVGHPTCWTRNWRCSYAGRCPGSHGRQLHGALTSPF